MLAPNKIHHHRTALALNNMAISFVRRGLYKQGLSVLKHALDAMRGACREPYVSPDETFNSSKLHRPNPRILERVSGMLAKLNANEETSSTGELGRDIVTVDYYHEDGLQAAGRILRRRRGIDDGNTSFIIRINDFDAAYRNMSIDSSILLHNYSVAHMCLARVTVNPDGATNLQEKAYQIAMYANETVSASLKCFTQDPENVPVDDLMQSDPNLFLACIIVLDNLTLMYRIALHEESAKDLSDRLSYACFVYQSWEESLESPPSSHAAAA